MIDLNLTKEQTNRLARRVSQYGITMDDFLHLLKTQNGCCPICENELILFGTGKSAIDHCHRTNHVRGIICHQCNVWIGMYESRGLKLMNMIQYLRSDDNRIVPSTSIYDRKLRKDGTPRVFGKGPCGGGRPVTGKAMTSRERQAAYRARKKLRMG